jgi:hypothetical protein
MPKQKKKSTVRISDEREDGFRSSYRRRKIHDQKHVNYSTRCVNEKNGESEILAIGLPMMNRQLNGRKLLSHLFWADVPDYDNGRLSLF